MNKVVSVSVLEKTGNLISRTQYDPWRPVRLQNAGKNKDNEIIKYSWKSCCLFVFKNLMLKYIHRSCEIDAYAAGYTPRNTFKNVWAIQSK